MFRYFDAHCHLASITGAAPASTSAGDARVFGRMICGVDPSDWGGIADTAPRWPGSRAAYGLHPWRVGDAPPEWPDLLAERLRADPGAWVGEIGLDPMHVAAIGGEREQLETCRRQLRLAKAMSRRINLHCVKAWGDLVELLDTEYLPAGGFAEFVVHAYGGPHQFIPLLADRGAYFTVGPLTTRHDSPRQRSRAALLPGDRILLESDAYLTPGEDEAAALERTLARLAEAQGCDPETLGEVIEENSRRLFGDG